MESSSSSTEQLPAPAQYGKVWIRLRGYWVTCEEIDDEDTGNAAVGTHAKSRRGAAEGQCGFPGCIFKEKHGGPHGFDEATLALPTPKRQTGVSSKQKFLIDADTAAASSSSGASKGVARKRESPSAPKAPPAAKRRCASSTPASSLGAASPPSCARAAGTSSSGLEKPPPANIPMGPLPTSARSQVDGFEMEDDEDGMGYPSPGGLLPPGLPGPIRGLAPPPRFHLLAGGPLTGAAVKQAPAKASSSTANVKQSGGQSNVGAGRMVTKGRPDAATARQPAPPPQTVLPFKRVHVRMAGWWETVDSLRTFRLWALEGQCNFPGCPLADRHSGPHQFCKETARMLPYQPW
jgi:hypothetical protein